MHPKHGQQSPPTHAPHPDLPPADALAWSRLANDKAVQAQAAGRTAAAAPRPGGAGRYVVAVLACAELAADLPARMGLAPADILLLSAPGAFVSAEAIAELERAQREDRLSLCVVLTHDGCRNLAAGKATTPAQQAVERRGQPARELAARRNLSVDKAQALLQQQAILSASTQLSSAVTADTFRIVPARLDARSGAITWHTTRAEELPIPVVR
ncbi:MAG: hypothetical protein IPK26_30675 [Planctomycetes bacterium]|nr:hypothetical protein [Planctomycetota bacterium]